MRRILVDASAYSGFIRGHPGIVESMKNAENIYLSPVVLGELYTGFMQGSALAKNEQRLHDFFDSPRVSLVQLDEDTAKLYAAIQIDLKKNGTPISTNDIWISASAMQYGLAVLTLDRDFFRVQQIITLCPETPAS